MAVTSSPYEETIWFGLLAYLQNEYGVAALMGNIQHEGGMYPARIQGSQPDDPINAYYTRLVDRRNITRADFAEYPIGGRLYTWTYHHTPTSEGTVKTVTIPDYGTYGKGWGLVQWTTNDRKRNLYDATVGRGMSIASVQGQINFTIQELMTSYPSIYNDLTTSEDLSALTYRVLAEFEHPPDIPGQFPIRLASAQAFYNEWTGRPVPPIPPEPGTGSGRMPLWMMMKRRLF